MKAVGTRATFRIFAGFAAVSGLIYFAFNHLYMRKRPSQGVDITKADTTKPENSSINLSTIDTTNGIIIQEVIVKEDMLPYEDALTNLGYEDTEINEDDYQTTKP